MARAAAAAIERLLAIMARLRDPDGGCPWDREQDFATIAPYTIEEAYEVADAIARGDMGELAAELGDLLFQVVFHARMAEERGAFGFADVATAIADKMERRHPHVFGTLQIGSADEQSVAWEAHKLEERRARGGAKAGALAGVPLALPALARALKLGQRAARVGFDWSSPDEVTEKLREECAELVEAAGTLSGARKSEEFGDLLFAMVQLGRHLGVDAEDALRRANGRFEERFARIEAALRAQGREPESATLAELEALWQRAKAEDKR